MLVLVAWRCRLCLLVRVRRFVLVVRRFLCGLRLLGGRLLLFGWSWFFLFFFVSWEFVVLHYEIYYCEWYGYCECGLECYFEDWHLIFSSSLVRSSWILWIRRSSWRSSAMSRAMSFRAFVMFSSLSCWFRYRLPIIVWPLS